MELEFARVPITHPDVLPLLDAVQQEYVVFYGEPDGTPYEVDEFEAPQGAFFVGYLDGVAVLTGAWRFRDDLTELPEGGTRAAEVKRMYVAPSARRGGNGLRMLRHLEADARAHGADVMVLETGAPQEAAISLYQAAGYVPMSVGFGYYRDSSLVRYFARRIDEPATPPHR